MSESKLTLILERVRPGKRPECFKFWACRGANKGCDLKKVQSDRGRGKHCPDCVPCDNWQETLGHLLDRVNRGDA